MKNRLLALLFAVAAGVLAGALRSKTGGALFAALAAVLLICAALLAAFTRPVRASRDLRLAVSAIGAVAFLGAAVKLLITSFTGGVLIWIRAIFLVICAFASVYALGEKNGDGKGVALLAPVFYGGFILLFFYRANAADPFVTRYIIELFAVVVALLGVYSRAVPRFEPKRESSGAAFTAAGVACVCFLIFCGFGSSAYVGMDALKIDGVLTAAGYLAFLAGGLLFATEAEFVPEDKQEDVN